MKITYLSKNYKISNNFKEVIERKLQKLEKYFNKNTTAKVNCIAENDMFKLEITLNANGLFLRSEVFSDNMYNNIDIALPKIEKQINKNLGKYKSKFNKEIDNFVKLDELVVEEPKPIVKKKKFKLEPLTIEDAEAFMEALDHNFFVFENAKTGQVNIIYRRKDDNMGLIEIDK